MSQGKAKTLVAVQGPTQFVAAFIAYLWYQHINQISVNKAVLLIYDTSVPEENEEPLKSAIERLASISEWSNIIFINQLEMRKISLNRYSNSISQLRVILGRQEFETVFIARDYGSFGTQLILNTYPNATHIEYGDSFGLVGDESALSTSIRDVLKCPLSIFKSFVKKLIFLQFPSRFRFKLSILTMPLDWMGSYLSDRTLLVPNKEFAKKVFLDISKNIPEVTALCDKMLSDNSSDVSLYLLSNLANSGLCTYENELNLYLEIVCETAKKGSTIIIKNHPRGSKSLLTSLCAYLQKDYIVKIIDNHHFNFYPIELWTPLLERCRIFPIFSTSVISLKYLFSKNVTMPLDREKINKYIYWNKVNYILQSEEISKQAIKSLEGWDGNSPLWQGSKAFFEQKWA